jgi:hypothetical protein
MMMRRRWTLMGALLSCWAAVSLGACGTQTGTESGNPSLDFTTTECKSKEPAAEPQSAARWSKQSVGSKLLQTSAIENSSYDGLNCFVWERIDDETLRIEVTNHADGCSENEYWEPQAELNDDGTLDLRLENPSCTKAACGWCIYDLSFTVKVPSSIEDLDVRVFGDSCSGEATVDSAARLTLGSGARGEVCGYANPNALRWMCATGKAGRFAPCSAEGDCYSEGTACGAGLSCVELDEPRCTPPCEADADCADFASTSCTEGHCVLHEAP